MLRVADLTYRLGDRLLFDGATAALPDGARVGLVGRNGAGKTTLLRLLTGEMTPESGSVALPRGARIGRVEQEAPGGPISLLDVVLAADTERAALLAEADALSAQANPDPARVAEVQVRLADIDAHSAPARAASILGGLGLDQVAIHRPCSDFSGGWRMRVALAGVLFAQPDLLLLDEPTNYLDLEGALWLQGYLARYPYSLLVISHDRDFLDEAVDHVLHLDRGRLQVYRGNYSSFARQRAEQSLLAQKAAAKQAAERKDIQAFVDRFRAVASKARQAQSRIKRLEKMAPIALSEGESPAMIDIPSPEKALSPPLIHLDGASVGYGGPPVLSKLSLSIAEDDRIGLLGSNGNGKSTLVKLLASRLQPAGGRVTRSGKLKVAYFAQHQLDELSEDDTPASAVGKRMPGQPTPKVRARAARMGFSGQAADKRVGLLSGGEKARLLLGLAAFDGPHLLILDEPTNHLDVEARAALVEALAAYTGAVVIVSHDRFLLDATCDRLWLVAGGTVKPFDGDIDDYAKLILRGEGGGGRPGGASGKAGGGKDSTKDAGKDAAAAPAPVPTPLAPPSPARKAATGPLRKRLDQLNLEVARLTKLVERVDGALADPRAFAAPDRAAALARDRATLAERLAKTEEDWLVASEALEGAG